MAVDEIHPDSNEVAPSGTVSGIINILGAAVSLSLLIGVTVWAYQLITRDVSGVPVVRAAEGPLRVQPDSPGGDVADHQGLSVNDVAAVGTASKPADRLILAPAPLDLSQDDVVQPARDEATEETAQQTEQHTEQPSEQEIAENAATATPAAEADDAPFDEADAVQLAAVEALANSLANGVDPISTDEVPDVAAPEVAAPEAPTEPEDEIVEEASAPVEGGLGRSLRPQMRPTGLGGVPQQTVSAGPVSDIDPDTLPVGTRLAQLGAFASADIAREQWDRLSEQFSDYLGDKGRVIQRASSGGRTFYRLRAAGFEDLSDARRFCSALVAERAECIPVVTR